MEAISCRQSDVVIIGEIGGGKWAPFAGLTVIESESQSLSFLSSLFAGIHVVD